MARIPVAFACLLLFPIAVRAAEDPFGQMQIPAASSATASRIESAGKLANDKQWAEAVEEYRKVIEESGDDLVAQDEGRRFIRARRACHEQLAKLPAEALKLYRDKADPQVKKWFEKGEKENDARLLRRVVDEAFAGRYADRAMDMLGDLDFERGRFDEADRWWSMLAPTDEETGLRHPDPQVDVPRVRAKRILARAFQGQDTNKAFDDFKKRNAQAEGALAGRTGKYVEALEPILKKQATRKQDADETWSTFAAFPHRNTQWNQAPDRLRRSRSLEEPHWTHPLERDIKKIEQPAALSESREMRSLAFYPVAVGDQVVVADARTVTAYHLITGERALWFDIEKKHGELGAKIALPAEPDLRWSLTVAGDSLFVRLGAEAVGPIKENAKNAANETFLVCLDPRAKVQGDRERWTVRLKKKDTDPIAFEGAPVVHEGQVFIAATHFDVVNTTSIHCYDALTGTPRWRQPIDVCSVSDSRHGAARHRHHLLTLAGSSLVYCSHSGAIVALDTEGRRKWAVRYTSRGLMTAQASASPRDLAPCVVANGRVYAAPADYDRILCLDLETGSLLWESEPPAEVVHLLGVAREKLFFTTPSELRAVTTQSGRTLRDWIQPGDGSKIVPHGRGFLTPDKVYWPTRDGLRILDLETGQPEATLPHVRGNLLVAKNCLITTDLRDIKGYVPPAYFLEERRRQVQAQPASSDRLLALAEAEADAGKIQEAVDRWSAVERQDAKRRDEALGRRHAVLLAEARRLSDARRWDDADQRLEQAAGEDFTIPARLEALAGRALLWSAAEKPERAVSAWQALLSDEKLRSGGIVEPNGMPRPARVVAGRAIRELIRKHGAGVYQPFEAQARKAFEDKNRSREFLERIAADFPNSSVARSALRELVALGEKQKDPRAIAAAHRLFLQLPDLEPEEIALGLAEAARFRQSCGDAETAIALWQRVAHEHGDCICKEIDAKRTLAQVAAAILTELKPPTAPDAELVESWKVETTERVVGADPGGVYCCQADSFTCRDPTTGKSLWTAPLPSPAFWASRYADSVVCAHARGVACLQADTGNLRWKCDLPGDVPCAEARLIGTRLLLSQDRTRVLVLDLETGDVAWQRFATGGRLQLPDGRGRFNACLYVDAQRFALQDSTNQVLILDTATGKPHGPELGMAHWISPPVFLERTRLCVATDRDEILCVNLADGKPVWTKPLAKPTLTMAPPRLFERQGKLIVLLDSLWLYGLDPKTGKELWERKTGAEPLEGLAVDDGTAYFVSEGIIQAIALADGRRRWEGLVRGSSASWHMQVVGGRVLAVPAKAELARKRAWLLGGFLPNVPIEVPWRDLPAVLFDAKDGKVLQQWSFKVQGPAVDLRSIGSGLVANTHGFLRGLTPKS